MVVDHVFKPGLVVVVVVVVVCLWLCVCVCCCLFVCLLVCLFACLFVCFCVFVFVCLLLFRYFVYVVLFYCKVVLGKNEYLRTSTKMNKTPCFVVFFCTSAIWGFRFFFFFNRPRQSKLKTTFFWF